MSYLGLTRWFPIGAIDGLIISLATVSLIALVRDADFRRLPTWLGEKDNLQRWLVLGALLFMLISAFGDMCNTIDDDLWIHFPNIKRAAMGDIPIHNPYFPDSLLRGHTARDVFTGTIARLSEPRPDLAIIYATLAICPAYIFMFHFLARRLAGGDRLQSCLCFFGLLFFVSFAIGGVQIRAGSITYVFNNNQLAVSYAAFFAWLIQRIASTIKISDQESVVKTLWKQRWLLGIGIVTYASQYFIYISNFLMFSLFLAAFPVLLLIASREQRRRRFFAALTAVGITILGAIMIHLVVSPLLFERILISLKLCHNSEPMGWTQQATLTFPKAHLFTITDCSGTDVDIFRRRFLVAQGLSFYVGLLGLAFGIFRGRMTIAALSLFGWLTMLWLATVDMGEYRADPLRLFLAAHIAFGAVTALMMGISMQEFFRWLNKQHTQWPFSHPRLCKACSVVILCTACLWMSQGSAQKFMAFRHWDIVANAKNLVKIHTRNPEDWQDELNISKLDADVFALTSQLVRSPQQRLLLNAFEEPNCPETLNGAIYKKTATPQLINAAYVTGAGLVGVCQAHALKGMGSRIIPTDYRASLFWQQPSEDLLHQLGPDLIVLDPAVIPPHSLEKVMTMHGVQLIRSLEDNAGHRRLILSVAKERQWSAPASKISSIIARERHLVTTPFGLAQLPVTITPPAPPEQVKVGLQVIDEGGQLVNTMDQPIAGVISNGNGDYQLCFSMIQSGHWTINFIDPATHRVLNTAAIEVDVEESKVAADKANSTY